MTPFAARDRSTPGPGQSGLRQLLVAAMCTAALAPVVCAVAPWSLRVAHATERPGDHRLPADDPVPAGAPRRPPIIRQEVLLFPTYSLFLDPDPYVVTKEFAFFYNTVPDPAKGPGRFRGLFHLVYQRSAGPQQAETLFGHAWSSDLRNWAVDTAAFAVDTTAWNKAHVWSPSLIRHGNKDYLFYTGVDSLGEQRIGYASTDLLDTTNTVWDPERVKVWEASDTRWAVPRPWTYSHFTQFRDAFVMHDPEHPGRLLMFFNAHDSTEFLAGQGGLVVGVARSEPGTVNAWQDLGYYPSTLSRETRVGQLEGPHLIPLPGTNAGWRLMFSNAGSPLNETGSTTIRFQTMATGASVSDTSRANWGTSRVLSDYLNDRYTVFGWSGSEHLRVGDADYLAGFTAWGPRYQGIAFARMKWEGDNFTLGGSTIAGVDDLGPPAREVQLRRVVAASHARRVTFEVDAPFELDARLEVFDTGGRRVATLLTGKLPSGRSSVHWELAGADGAAVASGVYFARLSFAGGVRVVRVALVR